MKNKDEIEKLCKNIWDMAQQAPHDFCGEQRDFYIPKLMSCIQSLAILYKNELARVVLDEE